MSAMPAPPRSTLDRPKDPAKRAAILASAKQLFAEHGFDGVSMDQIAQAAGVSKLTVYSHFGDKDGLLTETVRAHCEQELPMELFRHSPEIGLRERLLEISRAFYAMVSCPEAVAGHRMLCAPNAISPAMAERFWEAGPARIQSGLAELLQRRVESGELAIDDPDEAASHFFALIKGEPHARLIIGHPQPLQEATITRHLTSGVDLFLRAYRAAPCSPQQ